MVGKKPGEVNDVNRALVKYLLDLFNCFGWYTSIGKSQDNKFYFYFNPSSFVAHYAWYFKEK